MASNVEKAISGLRVHNVKFLMSDDWWALIDSQNKLCQQALADLTGGFEGVLQAFSQNADKLPTIINEILCISIWKNEVLPIMLEDSDEETMGKFCLLYIVLYHESTLVSLLEILLFHGEMCAALDDSAIELIDYCAAAITYLITQTDDLEESNAEKLELKDHSKNIYFGIGMRCITIIMYLAENMEKLNLSVTSRLYLTHDFPLLLTNLIERAPWMKENKEGVKTQFTDGYWHEKSEGSLMGRHEANAWLAIHQLLLHPELGKHYHVTDYAKGQFMRLESKISEALLSQLPPLQQLKQGLLYMASFQMPTERLPVLLELMPEMRNELLADGKYGWDKIAKIHKARLNTCKNMSEIAERFSKTLAPMEKPVNLCTNCSRPAKSRCSKCKKAWYCNRDCQLQHFPYHKTKCTPSTEKVK